MRMDDVLALLERQDMGDQEMVDYLAHALQEPGEPAAVHRDAAARLPARLRGDPHPRRRGRLAHQQRPRAGTCSARCTATRSSRSSYRRPGFLISREVAAAFAAHPNARAILLEKHGTICWGATVKDAYDATIELISRAEEAIAHRAKGRARFGGVGGGGAGRRRRGGAWRSRWRPRCAAWSAASRRQVLLLRRRADVLEFAASREARRPLPGSAPRRPTTRSTPSGCRASRRSRTRRRSGGGAGRRSPTAVERFVDRLHGLLRRRTTRDGATLTDPFPRVDRGGAASACSRPARTARTAGIVGRHLPPHDLGARRGHLVRAATSRSRRGRLRRGVLAARALQALAGPAREGAGPAHRAGHRGRERHRPGRGPAAGRRGRARGRDRSRRGGRAQGGRGDRGGPRDAGGRSGSGWT